MIFGLMIMITQEAAMNMWKELRIFLLGVFAAQVTFCKPLSASPVKCFFSSAVETNIIFSNIQISYCRYLVLKQNIIV